MFDKNERTLEKVWFGAGLRLLAAAIASSVAFAVASPAAAQAMHQSPHMEETSNIVGLKGGLVGAFNDGHSALGGGFSPFYERNLIHGWLELETALVVAFTDRERVVGFDVFLKKPFHANQKVNPYVGIGPNVAILIGPEEGEDPGAGEVREVRTRAGLLLTAGSYFWFGEGRWGLDAELVYLLLFNDGLTHELAVEVGPSFRF